MFTHKNLDVWQRSMDLVDRVYTITEDFPGKEQFGLTSQIRRAGVSVPVNISEGAARHSPKDYIRFIRISFGSLSELETLFLICKRRDFINEKDLYSVLEEIRIIGSQLSKLIKSLENHVNQK
jgi:four helix bundle protein